MMDNAINNMRKGLLKRLEAMAKHQARKDDFVNKREKGLLKRLEAMAKHQARKDDFVNKREMIIQDIEEARNIWEKTMDQLPKTEFQKF